jgi:transposase-like protein
MQKGRSRRSSSYLTRRRWTTDDARTALADLDASGLGLEAFALDAGLDPQRLRRWRRTLAALPSDVVFEEVATASAAPLRSVAVTAGSERGWFEVVLRSGRVVRVPESFDASALGRLLTVVEEGAAC